MSDKTGASGRTTIELCTDIVVAYAGRNEISTPELLRLIDDVQGCLSRICDPATSPARDPAVPIRKSVTRNFIICLEDGKKLKSLKRHLRVTYDMTPAQYREKWGLRPEYPMVAPSYSAARSAQAKSFGLGRRDVSHSGLSGKVRQATGP